MHADVPQSGGDQRCRRACSGIARAILPRPGNRHLRERTADAEAYGLDLGLAELALPHCGLIPIGSLLKADLQAVVDQWVERQKQVQPLKRRITATFAALLSLIRA